MQAKPGKAIYDLELTAHALAKRLPALLVEASRVAQTVAHGIHGRRRAGPGETFWQFRHYETGDSALLIDWRRSASSDHLFIREREWEAAHTVRLWPDLSPSMMFRSHLAAEPKAERALILAFAIGELLTEGGERIGLIGGGQPSAGRGTVQKIAMSISQVLSGRDQQASRAALSGRDQQASRQDETRAFSSLPPRARLNRFSECLLFSDFLDPPEEIAASLEYIAAQGVRGHLVQILDPAEETLPYNGRVEFLGLESRERLLAVRAEDLRAAYAERIAQHKEAVAGIARRFEWSYLLHHTDRPAGEVLLALHMHLSGQARSYRARGKSARGTA